MSAPHVTGPLVLVAEDDEDILALVALRLQRSGVRIVRAHDGRDALRLAAELRPDVAVLDVQMPALTGLEVLKALRASPETRDIPVILLTARASDQDAESGRALGAAGYVVKPIDFEHLRLCLESLLPVRDDARGRLGDAGGGAGDPE